MSVQCKFLYGAFLPTVVITDPSNATASAVDRRNTPCMSNDNGNIFYNNLSAKTLLVVVSYRFEFKKIFVKLHSHLHIDPVGFLGVAEE